VYHEIVFASDLSVDLERDGGQPLERVLLTRGARRRARVRPHVVESPTGPVEAADLFFSDGSVVRGVPFAAFAFAE
jgi:hypothetical protein